MSERFTGQVAVVTGGASGIGRAIAHRLVREGAQVVAADSNPDALGALGAELGEALHGVVTDVRVEAEVEAMVGAAVKRFGGLDVAFNCAGLGVFGELMELPEADWDTVIDVCLKGVYLSVKHEARRMREQNAGRGAGQGERAEGPAGRAIVNVASLNCRVPMFGGAAYACAKAGVEMLSRNAALELAPHRIRVNTLSPGLTDTPLTAGIRDLQGAETAFMERIPLERWGTPEDMAAAALFLASSEAGYISGANLLVDGGWETTGYPDLRPFRDALGT
jgi:NAD(P)-dependent dehydrogenase (short-subunit alcohol dehydrogenase family)